MNLFMAVLCLLGAMGWVADFVRGDKIGDALVCLFLATISALGFALWFRDFIKEGK